MTDALTESEVGKAVLDADGEQVGTVAEIHHGRAHVRADAETVAAMQTELDAGGIGEDTYAVEDEQVAEITDEEIVLQEDF